LLCPPPPSRPPLPRPPPQTPNSPPPPPATAPPGNAVRSYATITMALTQCTQAVTDAVRDAYTSFLKSQPGVVPDSVRVDVTCAEVVSGAGRGGGGPRRGGRGRAAPWGVGAGRAVVRGGGGRAGAAPRRAATAGRRLRRERGAGGRLERADPKRRGLAQLGCAPTPNASRSTRNRLRPAAPDTPPPLALGPPSRPPDPPHRVLHRKRVPGRRRRAVRAVRRRVLPLRGGLPGGGRLLLAGAGAVRRRDPRHVHIPEH
jgi:hypothetical protein